jgi:hypothetical protein
LKGSLSGSVEGDLVPAVQPFGFQDAPDAVAVEVTQEVGDHESEVVEGEVGNAAQGADYGALLLAYFPGQRVRAGGAAQAVCRTALAPFAHGFGADAVASGDGSVGSVDRAISARTAGVERAFG